MLIWTMFVMKEIRKENVMEQISTFLPLNINWFLNKKGTSKFPLLFTLKLKKRAYWRHIFDYI